MKVKDNVRMNLYLLGLSYSSFEEISKHFNMSQEELAKLINNEYPEFKYLLATKLKPEYDGGL